MQKIYGSWKIWGSIILLILLPTIASEIISTFELGHVDWVINLLWLIMVPSIGAVVFFWLFSKSWNRVWLLGCLTPFLLMLLSAVALFLYWLYPLNPFKSDDEAKQWANKWLGEECSMLKIPVDEYTMTYYRHTPRASFYSGINNDDYEVHYEHISRQSCMEMRIVFDDNGRGEVFGPRQSIVYDTDLHAKVPFCYDYFTKKGIKVDEQGSLDIQRPH